MRRCSDLPVLALAGGALGEPARLGERSAASWDPRTPCLAPGAATGRKACWPQGQWVWTSPEEGGHATSSDPVRRIRSMRPRGKSFLLPGPAAASSLGGVCHLVSLLSHVSWTVMTAAALVYLLGHSGMFSPIDRIVNAGSFFTRNSGDIGGRGLAQQVCLTFIPTVLPSWVRPFIAASLQTGCRSSRRCFGARSRKEQEGGRGSALCTSSLCRESKHCLRTLAGGLVAWN